MSRIPTGFKFRPSDEELITYLQHKALGEPLDSVGYIEECDIYEHRKPRDLFRGTKKSVLYFYVKLKKKNNDGLRINRRVAGTNGTWKETSKVSKVLRKQDAAVIGSKRSYVYALNGRKMLGYNMDELCLDGSIVDVPNIDNSYVVCCIKKKGQKDDQDEEDSDYCDEIDGLLSGSPSEANLPTEINELLYGSFSEADLAATSGENQSFNHEEFIRMIKDMKTEADDDW